MLAQGGKKKASDAGDTMWSLGPGSPALVALKTARSRGSRISKQPGKEQVGSGGYSEDWFMQHREAVEK